MKLKTRLQRIGALGRRRCAPQKEDGPQPIIPDEHNLQRFVFWHQGRATMILCGTSLRDACERHGLRLKDVLV